MPGEPIGRDAPIPAGRPLRIAAHNGAPEWGGAEIATSLLLAGLQSRGHTVRLWYNREVVGEGARGYGLEVRRLHLGGDIAVHHALRFGLALRRWRPDVLIVGTFRKLWLAALAARLAGVPVVARIGLSTDVPRSAKYRLVFRHLVDAVVTNAGDLEADYRRRLGPAARPLLRTIHKGIDPSPPRADRAAVRTSLGVPEDAVVIGGVGRLVEQKRFDRLLEAFAAVPRGPWLVIVGEGQEAEALAARAQALGVSDRVRLAGHRSDIPDVMDALDLLVVSSDRESLANVMLEAMAVGTPVVSTPVSGAEEALLADATEEAAGVVVRPEPRALAEAMAALVADPDRRAELGGAAVARVRERFRPEGMLAAWERVLRSVAEGG